MCLCGWFMQIWLVLLVFFFVCFLAPQYLYWYRFGCCGVTEEHFLVWCNVIQGKCLRKVEYQGRKTPLEHFYMEVKSLLSSRWTIKANVVQKKTNKHLKHHRTATKQEYWNSVTGHGTQLYSQLSTTDSLSGLDRNIIGGFFVVFVVVAVGSRVKCKVAWKCGN